MVDIRALAFTPAGARRWKVLLTGCAAAIAVQATPALAQTYVYQPGDVDPYGPIVLTQEGDLRIASGSAIQAGPISGDFPIFVGGPTGQGTLILTGENTYTGRTTIGGTLRIGNGGTTGSISNTSTVFLPSGFLEFDRSDRIVFAAPLLGPAGRGFAGLRQIGTGTTVLTADTLAVMGVHIQHGVLQLGDGGETGSLSNGVVLIDASAVLAINHSDSFNMSLTLSGAGSLHQLGSGVTVLTAQNTYTGGTVISAGALQIGRVGVDYTGGHVIVGDVLNNATLIFASGGSSFGGVVSGSGQVIKRDAYDLTLTGASTYTGPTIIEQGGLIVKGSLASVVTINPSATLQGTGSVGGAVVHGTLSPGNTSVDRNVLTINGPLTFGADGAYLVEVFGATADRVNVSGIANLAGALRLWPQGGGYGLGSTYTILSAAGGRTGTFSTVDVSGAFGPGIRPYISYRANSVVLTLLPNDLTPLLDKGGNTQNQRNVALAIDRGIEAGGDVSPFVPLYTLSAGALGDGLSSLSGEIHAATASSVAPVAGQFLGVMLDPFVADARHAPPDGRGLVAWGAVFGSTGRTGGDARDVGSATAEGHDGQLAFGADLHLGPNAILGAAISGGRNELSLVGDRGRAKSDTLQVGAYGLGRIGRLNVSGAVSRAVFDTDTHRSIPVLGLSDVSASYEMKVWSARVDASIPLVEHGGAGLGPVASLQWTSVKSPDIQESATDTAGALKVDHRQSDTARAELGVRATIDELAGADALSGFVQAGWGYYLERDRAMTASFTGLPGSEMTILGARPPRNVALISGGLDLKVGARATASVGFDGEAANRFDRVAGWARLRVAF